MNYSEWDRMWSEWLGEKPMEDFVRKSLNRNARAHEDFTPILKPDFKGFTTNGTHTHMLSNKNKDLA